MKRIFLIIIFPILYISCVAQQNIEADNVYVRDEIYKKDGGTYEVFSPGINLTGSPRGAILFEDDGEAGFSNRLTAGIDGVTDDTLMIMRINNTSVDYGLFIDITAGTNPGVQINNATNASGITISGTGGGAAFSSGQSGSAPSFYALHTSDATGNFMLLQKGASETQFQIDSSGQVHLYDTLFMQYFANKRYSRFLHLYVDSVTMSVKVDSISFSASEALKDPLRPLKEVLADTKDGEVPWPYYDSEGNKQVTYKLDGTPMQMFGQLQYRIEHNMRYIRGLEKQVAAFHCLLLVILILGGVVFVYTIFKR